MIVTDEDYIKYLPFISSYHLMQQLNITIEKIEGGNLFNDMLEDIYLELNKLLTDDTKTYPLENSVYELSKFYITILLLKGIDNIAITRIWIKYFRKKIEYNLRTLLSEYNTKEKRIDIFLGIFRLLEHKDYFKLNRITIGGNVAFGMHMLKYLDIEDTLLDGVTTLHKGYVIIPTEETDFIIKLIQDFAQKKIYKLYEQAELDVSITRKIKLVIDKIRDDVINSQKVSVNTKKHFIRKELLEEQERVRQAEQANIIIKELDDNKVNINSFPPCVVFILDKLINKKIQLSHYENLLLVSYLNKKSFPIEYIIKIFSKAVNYQKSITDYQVKFAIKKGMMPMSCMNLETEAICKKHLDHTNQCSRIKNPLVFR